MNFADAVASGFRNYVGFTGRARRSEFWWWMLFQFIVLMVAFAIDSASGNGSVVYVLCVLALFLPSLAVSVRRLHDTDRSGWWYLIGLIPLVGAILLLVWFCTDGTRGSNPFGADPKARSPGDLYPPSMAPMGAAAFAAAPPAGEARPNDAFVRLEQLGKLRDQGVLTQAEFDAEKAKLLGGGG